MEDADMVDSHTQLRPSSPASISSVYDSDAVNTSSARVYFGPFQSPEKKFVPVIARRRTLQPGDFNPPLRRSPRTSARPPSPPSQQDPETSDCANDGNDTGDITPRNSPGGTPENDAFLPPEDEPSSVLASKIMRAYDNPSPPPRNIMPESNYSLLKSGQFPQLDEPVSPVPFHATNLLERLNGSTSPSRINTPSSHHPGLAPSSITQLPVFKLDTPWNLQQFDLVDHTLKPDIFSGASPLVPTATTRTASSHIHTTPKSYVSSEIHSPAHNGSTPFPDDRSSHPVDVQVQSVTVGGSVEQDGLCGPSTSTQLAEPREDSSTSQPVDVLRLLSPEEQMLLEKKQKPLRRSPRRSATPQPPGLSHETSQPNVLKSKGKGRAISPFIYAVEQSDGVAGDYGSRRNSGGQQSRTQDEEKNSRSSGNADTRAKRELRSLSPESTNVLSQLLLPPQPVSVTELVAVIPVPATPGRDDSTDEGQRELRSLSPEIDNVLANLLLSSQPQQIPELVVHGNDVRPSTPHKQSTHSTMLHPNFVNSTLRRPCSPVKLGSGTLMDPTRTPARRVPMDEALTQGAPSIRKTTQLSAKAELHATGSKFTPLRSSLFSTSSLDDPNRSPAKRLPIVEAIHLNRGKNQISPARSTLRARSTSVEPKPAATPLMRSRSVEPTPKPEGKSLRSIFQRPAFPSARIGPKLPHPLVPGNELPPAIPEENEPPNLPEHAATVFAKKPAPTPSPNKSSLRQPSTSSRIPRIGAKPYARPAVTNSNNHGQPMVTLNSIVSAPKAMPLSTNVSSDMTFNVAAPSSGTGEGAKTSTSMTVERKQGVRTFSPPATGGITGFRQVIPGMLNAKYAPKAPTEPAVQAELSAGSSPYKPSGPIRIRRVVDGMFAKRHEKVTEPSVREIQKIEAIASTHSREAQADTEPSDLNARALSTVVDTSPTPPSSPLQHDEISFRSPQVDDGIADTKEGNVSAQNEGESSMRVRRTSRKRKPTTPTADVFGVVITRPLQLRKKVLPSTRSDRDGFQGMTAVALKALTASNTTKNQQSTIKLDTKVVRKEGIRPESPTMKVRTIMQKQREEKDRQRRERAVRRARRSDEGLGQRDGPGDRTLIESDDDSDGFLRLGKHRRGPGDEEDYETPARLEWPVKRLRYAEGQGEVAVQKKQVKWDYGLSTTIYIDDLHPQPNTPISSNVRDGPSKKGCLTPAAKAIRLDTLGNILDADNPLADVVHENIVVTKFVYDNDQQVQLEAIPTKMTRSKSRKAKSGN